MVLDLVCLSDDPAAPCYLLRLERCVTKLSVSTVQAHLTARFSAAHFLFLFPPLFRAALNMLHHQNYVYH